MKQDNESKSFALLISKTLSDRFKREQQIHLKAIENNGRRLRACIAINRYIENKEKWMDRNRSYLVDSTDGVEVVAGSQKQVSYYLFVEFLSNWNLNDVTADINRICQITRIPSASFAMIPVAFDNAAELFSLDKCNIIDAEDRIRTALKLVQMKSDELQLPVQLPDIANVKMDLRRIVEYEIDYGYPNRLNAFGSSTIDSALMEFDFALADKIAENPLD